MSAMFGDVERLAEIVVDSEAPMTDAGGGLPVAEQDRETHNALVADGSELRMQA